MRHGWVMAALLGACAGTTTATTDTADEQELAGDPTAEERDSQAADRGVAPPRESEGFAEAPPTAQPAPPPLRELRCVSPASQQPDEVVAAVWRLTLFVDGESAMANFARGPLFESHDGVWSTAAGPSARSAQLVRSSPSTFVAQDETQVSLALAGQGLFRSGKLVLDGSPMTLVCWDQLQLFGSAWSSQPSALPAHYNPALGTCVGNDGAPAFNTLPLEFVLEANYAECADLRGAVLNRDDHRQPDIALNLRGANLDGASLYFANLSGSFEGARLGTLDFGYARVSGSIDAWTQLPGQVCEVSDSPWSGTSMTCVR